ncbi:MAG: hypothetical protein LBR26_14150 [Prevotella sp.]|jgi:hypothetical protein|nr:hypothetical protein [Prevotella sp.]
MLGKGLKKHASNPVAGLLPFILFIVLYTVNVMEQYALFVSFVSTVIGEFFFRMYYKSRAFSMTFYISGISILITFIAWLAARPYMERPKTYVAICEVSIICLFMLLRASKTYMIARFFRHKNLIHKVLINEFYDSATLIQYGLTFHVFGMLLYRQLTVRGLNGHIFDMVVFSVLPILIILSTGIFQALKVDSLAAKLRKEEWIPIVTEKGEVTGKIAKNVSMNMKNKFLHPVVRVALISDTKVYLQERPTNDILNPGKLDYPFEKYMLFNQEINLAARNCIRQMAGDRIDLSVKFLLKYVFENENTRRLIFLFTAKTVDEDIIKKNGKINGKFWTIKQLEEGFADGIFSECFELEFEYLKNMVLVKSDIFAQPRASVN